jgi:hypothetical protein
MQGYKSKLVHYFTIILYILSCLAIHQVQYLMMIKMFFIILGFNILLVNLILNRNLKINLIIFLIMINIVYVASKIQIMAVFVDYLVFASICLIIFINIKIKKMYFLSDFFTTVTALSTSIISITLFKALVTNSAGILTILGLGYDNSAHVAAFRNAYKNPQSLFDKSNGFTEIPNSLFLNYPDIFHVFFGTIFQSISPTYNLNYTISFYFISIFYMMAVLILGLVNISEYFFLKKFKKIIIGIFTFFFFLLTQFSAIFISGFPHNLFSILVIILLLIIIREENSKWNKILFLMLGVVPLTFSTPQILPIYAVILLFIAISTIDNGLKFRFVIISHRYKIFLIIIPVIFSAYGLVQIINRFSLNQILAEGGVEPFGLIFYLSYAIIFIISIFFIKISLGLKSLDNLFSLLIVIVSATSQFVAIAFSLFTYVKLGYVSYYAIKSIYFSVPFIFLMIVMQLSINYKYIKEIYKIFPIKFLSAVAYSIFILSISYTGLWPTVFNGGFMSPIPVALKTFTNSELKGAQLVYGPQILNAIGILESRSSDKIGIFVSEIHGSDLNSRWLNGLNGTWSDENWKLFYNSTIKSVNLECASKSNNLLIFADLPEESISLLQNCIKYQEVIPFSRDIEFIYAID